MKIKTENILILDVSHGIGSLFEGPYWSQKKQCLYWVDIIKKIVYVYNYTNGDIKSIELPEKISSVVETKDNKLLVSGEQALWCVSIETSKFSQIVKLKQEPKGNRCNDAKCDPYGNFWFSTMDKAEMDARGSLWCLRKSGELLKYKSGIGIGNTLAWDIERKRMYFGDSLLKTIFVMDYTVSNGIPIPGKREVFVGPGIAPGIPDGSALDKEGFLWNTRWDGGCLARISPSGKLDCLLNIDAQRPTSCAFIGADLKILAVTTASYGLNPKKITKTDGRMLAIGVDVAGAAIPGYGGVINSNLNSDRTYICG